jgi:hypothetical protein
MDSNWHSPGQPQTGCHPWNELLRACDQRAQEHVEQPRVVVAPAIVRDCDPTETCSWTKANCCFENETVIHTRASMPLARSRAAAASPPPRGGASSCGPQGGQHRQAHGRSPPSHIHQKMAAAAALSCGSTSLEFLLEPSIKLTFQYGCYLGPPNTAPRRCESLVSEGMRHRALL